MSAGLQGGQDRLPCCPLRRAGTGLPCLPPMAPTPFLPHRLREILEVAEDMEIDIPHIWLYLAELITPILREGGIPMEELFR